LASLIARIQKETLCFQGACLLPGPEVSQPIGQGNGLANGGCTLNEGTLKNKHIRIWGFIFLSHPLNLFSIHQMWWHVSSSVATNACQVNYFWEKFSDDNVWRMFNPVQLLFNSPIMKVFFFERARHTSSQFTWARQLTHVKSIHVSSAASTCRVSAHELSPYIRHVSSSPTNTCQGSRDAGWKWEECQKTTWQFWKGRA